MRDLVKWFIGGDVPCGPDAIGELTKGEAAF
jgi:hypothetical protein